MRLTPDQLILWQFGFIKLNGTIVTTWGLMLLLTTGACLITRKLTNDVITSRWQAALEILVTGIDEQIKEVGLAVPGRYIAFIGTLFIFIATANLLTIVPGYEPPTSSLSTTAALAVCVFVAVPVFGIAGRGWRRYLKSYLEPTVIMLPFNSAT
jgi:F-type H+-transporting ATPase subunit a